MVSGFRPVAGRMEDQQDSHVKTEPGDEQVYIQLSTSRDGSVLEGGLLSQDAHIKTEPGDDHYSSRDSSRAQDILAVELESNEESRSSKSVSREENVDTRYLSKTLNLEVKNNTESPELRRLLNEPLVKNDASDSDPSVNWFHARFREKFGTWEGLTNLWTEHTHGSANTVQEEDLVKEEVDQFGTSEFLRKPLISPRKRPDHDISVQTIIKKPRDYHGNGKTEPNFWWTGKENSEIEAYPASAMLRKMCAEEESKIKSRLTSPSDSGRMRTSTGQDTGNYEFTGIRDVMRRMVTSVVNLAAESPQTMDPLPLKRNSKSDSDLTSQPCSTVTSGDHTMIRRLLTSPFTPIAPSVTPVVPSVKTDKPVLLNLLTSPPAVRMPTTPLFSGLPSVTSKHPMQITSIPPRMTSSQDRMRSSELRRLLNRPLTKLVNFDHSDKFRDLAHFKSRLTYAGICGEDVRFFLQDDDIKSYMDDMIHAPLRQMEEPDFIEPESTGNVLYPCTDCDKTFTVEEHLLEHLVVHEDMFYMCPECGDEFGDKSALLNHKKKHRDIEMRFGNTSSLASTSTCCPQNDTGYKVWEERDESDSATEDENSELDLSDTNPLISEKKSSEQKVFTVQENRN